MAASIEAMENYYGVLGLENFETDKNVIRECYKKMISPYSAADKETNVQAQKIIKAYRILMDDNKRNKHNLELKLSQQELPFPNIVPVREVPDWYKKAGGDRMEFYRSITLSDYFKLKEEDEVKPEQLATFNEFIAMLHEIFPLARTMHSHNVVSVLPYVLTYLESLNYKETPLLELKNKLKNTSLLVERISAFREGLKLNGFNPELIIKEFKGLIQEGADPTVTGAGGWNILHCAAYVNNVDLVLFIEDQLIKKEKQQLLTAKTNSSHSTPTQLAELRLEKQKKYLAIVKILRNMCDSKVREDSSQPLSTVVDEQDLHPISRAFNFQGFHIESQKKALNTLKEQLNDIPGVQFEVVMMSQGQLKPHLRMTYPEHTDESQVESLMSLLKSCSVTVDSGKKGSQMFVMVIGVEDQKEFQKSMQTLHTCSKQALSSFTPK